MDKVKKKQIKRILALVLAAAVVLVLAVMPLMAKPGTEADGPKASILSGTVAQAEISTVIKGGGTLAEEAAVEVSVPGGVMLTEYLVGNEDTVAAGDALAVVDRVSVMGAITQVQQTLDYLAEQIEEARDEEVSGTVTAQAGGRVKILYAKEGDNVRDVMLEYGALAVLSLDGLMAVELETNAEVSAGDSVTVTLGDGTGVTGMVESALGGKAVITIEDAGYAVGEKVQVHSGEGLLGSGELYIFNEWRATAYSGVVSKISVSEETAVTAGKPLMTLTDTEYPARFQTLAGQRREYEALMLELFRLYQDTVVTADCGGQVSGVDAGSAFLLSDSGGGWSLSLLANAPNGDDTQIYNNYLALVTAVDPTGWSLLLNPNNLPITDYKTLSGISIDPAAMTQSAAYAGTAPVYELADGEWRQIDAASIAAGDTLLFAGDASGNFVWVVRVAAAAAPETPAEPSEPLAEPAEPTQPIEPTEPGVSEGSAAAEPTVPAGEAAQSPQMPSQSGGYAGFGGGTVQEEPFEPYSLERNTILSVTPQDKMTLSITVDEQDIGKLKLGQTAAVKLDALQNESFTALVTGIGTSGENNGGSSKFTAELTLDRSERMLAGMNATASIALDERQTVLCIPVAALNEDESRVYVYTSFDADSGLLGGPVFVETGISDGENVQILSGLEEGQTYYYAYYDTLEISNTVESGGSFFR